MGLISVHHVMEQMSFVCIKYALEWSLPPHLSHSILHLLPFLQPTLSCAKCGMQETLCDFPPHTHLPMLSRSCWNHMISVFSHAAASQRATLEALSGSFFILEINSSACTQWENSTTWEQLLKTDRNSKLCLQVHFSAPHNWTQKSLTYYLLAFLKFWVLPRSMQSWTQVGYN